MKIKKLLRRSYKDESGALNDFIGLIIFLIVIFMMLVPLVVELMVYTGQTQEVDRLTKIAAKRACSMTAAPEQKSTAGGDLNMGSVGAGINILALPIIVDSVRREAAHPEQYSRFELTLYDATGQVVEAEENFTMETPSGNSAQIALAGANGEGSLCPSGGGDRWDYCREPGSDEAIKKQLKNTGGTENTDLIQRMERFQAGRCRQGENCRGDFVGRIDRCTVCASKKRQSIFGRGFDDGTGFFGILSCRTEADKRVLPCKIQACASEKLTQVGGTRGYNRAYLDAKNFGSIGKQAGGGNAGGSGAKYTAAEIHYGEAQNQNNTLSTGETSTKWHADEWDNSYKPHGGSTPQAGKSGQQQRPDPTDLKATNNGFGTLDEQYGTIKTH